MRLNFAFSFIWNNDNENAQKIIINIEGKTKTELHTAQCLAGVFINLNDQTSKSKKNWMQAN